MPTGVPVQIIAPGQEGTAVLNVDVVLNESYDLPSKITKFPVERGSTISDHIFNEPIVVTLRCLVTGSPIVISQVQFNTAQQAADNLAQGKKGAAAIPSPTAEQAAAADLAKHAPTDAFDTLEAIRDARQSVTLIAGLKRYPSMALANLHIERDRKTGNVLDFVVRFEEIALADSQTITFPALRGGKTKDQGDVRDSGKQTPTDVDENSSFARDLRNAYKKARGQPLTPVQQAGVK